MYIKECKNNHYMKCLAWGCMNHWFQVSICLSIYHHYLSICVRSEEIGTSLRNLKIRIRKKNIRMECCLTDLPEKKQITSRSLRHRLKFSNPISLQSNGLNLWCFKLRLFGLTKIVWNIGLRHDIGIRESEFVAKTQFLWSK